MIPAITTSWTRPNLTENGTIGGNAFAVLDPGPMGSTTNPYMAVDGNMNTDWYCRTYGAQTFIFYNPGALKVTNITYTLYSSFYALSNVAIQSSNDGVNWVDIESTYSGSGTTYTSTLTNSLFYKYYKLICTPYSTYSYVDITDIAITATCKTPVS